MVKNRHILLVGIFVLAGFFLTFLVGYHFHYVAQRRYEAYQGVVKEALAEALLSEIDKRDTIPIPYHGDIGGNHSKKQSEDCYTLQAKTEVGALEMTVSETKLKENITDNATISGLHSLLLSLNPMNADTLYKEIQRIMPASMVKRGRQWIRLNYTDNNKVQTTTYAPDSTVWQHADSLYSRNVGYLCELEATVFTFPVWFQLLTMKEWGLCIAMLLLWLMVYVWRKPLFARIERQKLFDKLAICAMRVILERGQRLLLKRNAALRCITFCLGNRAAAAIFERSCADFLILLVLLQIVNVGLALNCLQFCVIGLPMLFHFTVFCAVCIDDIVGSSTNLICCHDCTFLWCDQREPPFELNHRSKDSLCMRRQRFPNRITLNSVVCSHR